MENNMVYPCIANFAPDQLARKIIAENLSIGKGAAERPPFHSCRTTIDIGQKNKKG